MKASIILVLLCCFIALATPAPSFGVFAKHKQSEIKYELTPHLGFAKYNAIRYEPLRELPAAAPAPEAPYPAAAPPPPPVPSGPYPPQI